VGRVREAAREPLPGEIRLQWWSEVLNGERAGEARANPVASALLDVIAAHKSAAPKLAALVDAHRFDLYDEPMASLADLEVYARQTSSALLAVAAEIVAGEEVEEAAQPAGIASAIAGLLQSFPVHASRGQLYLPREVIERHGVEPNDIFAGQSSAGLRAALAELRAIGRRALASAHAAMTTVPRDALPAFLPVALVRAFLDLAERGDPFSPAELSPWRRQWLIWRAARNPARIAG